MAKATDQSRTGSVTIATLGSLAEGRELAAKLESAGIESQLTVERAADSPSTKNRWFSGIKIQVRRSDVPRALYALQLSRAEQDESAPCAGKSENATAFSPIRLNLESWQEAAIVVGAIIALAALLALWLF